MQKNSQLPHPQLRPQGCCLVGVGEGGIRIDTPSCAHPDWLLCLGKWGAWGRGKNLCRVVSLSKDKRQRGRTQLTLQVRTCIHKHSVTGKEGHSRGSSCCYHPHSTQKWTQKRIQFLSELYSWTRAFPWKIRGNSRLWWAVLTGQVIIKLIMQFSVLSTNTETQPVQSTVRQKITTITTAKANCTIY